MTRRFSLFASAALTLILTAPAAVAWAETPQWPQAHSDLKPDAGVRFGMLPNGMRYAVMRNATPAGQVSLRLRIGSGSLQENDLEQGLAHVLEHMAFRGSTHVPADQMIPMLERKGLAFGPDTNAMTEWTQTVYMLDLPHNDADSLATGLTLMRETAGELTLDAGALEKERGVVLSEERLRDTPDYRAEKAQIELFLHGQLAARRFPIGTVDVIKTAPAERLKAFYRANYRPERATLIVVGDFDAAAMEARVQAVFGDWKAVGPARPEPDLGKVESRGTVVKLVETPGSQTRAVIAWTRPHDDEPDSAAKERRETIENLGLAVLNRRMAKLAQGADPPFLGAGAGFENLFHSGKIAVVEAVSPPAGWKASLQAADREVRRLVAFGVSQAELDREISDLRASLRNAAAGAATRPTPGLASGLVDSVDNDSVFTAPDEDLRIFEAAVAGLTADQVNQALKAVFAGSGPLVELASPQPVEGGEAAVAAAFGQAQAEPLAAPTAQTQVAWPYGSFGPAGKVVERRLISDMGATQVRYANGVALIVKPTDYRKDQVLISVRVGHGKRDLSTDHITAAWGARAFTHGGYGQLDFDDAQRALSGHLVAVGFSVGDDAYVFNGGTRPSDLALQLQATTAYLTDPGFRPEAFERLRAAQIAALPQAQATPEGVLQREIGQLLANGDKRFASPDSATLHAASPADLPALLKTPLSRGSIEVTVVGDVSAETVIAEVAATLGALPPRPTPDAPAPAGAPVKFPAATPTPVRLTHTGRADQSVAMVAWPQPDFYADMRRSRAAMLAGEVLGNRLVETVRMAQGATYSPETQVDRSQTFAGYGLAISLVEIPPEKAKGFFDTVDAIVKDLTVKPPTADELERARNPRLAGLHKAQMTNEYWLQDLAGAVADPRRLELIRSTFPDYEAVTPADIQSAVRDSFRPDQAWRLVITAKP